LAPGTELKAVDKAARSVIEAAGYGEKFPHGLGHGVGLEIHEAPMLRHDAAGKLEPRTPVTVEPGVYLPGKGGVRIEDTLVVLDAADGGPELLTMTTKELLVLD
jgi:Xaa-Pro aminopeptidase